MPRKCQTWILDARLIDRWHPASTRLLQLSCCLRWLFEALQKSRLLLVELNKPPAAHTERSRCVLTASALIKNMACWEQREVRTRLLKDSPLSLPAENFNFPQEPVVAQHALCPASGPLGRGRGKIGSNCSGGFQRWFRCYETVCQSQRSSQNKPCSRRILRVLSQPLWSIKTIKSPRPQDKKKFTWWAWNCNKGESIHERRGNIFSERLRWKKLLSYIYLIAV